MDRSLALYEPPMLVEVGEFDELTNGCSCGHCDSCGCGEHSHDEIEF